MVRLRWPLLVLALAPLSLAQTSPTAARQDHPQQRAAWFARFRQSSDSLPAAEHRYFSFMRSLDMPTAHAASRPTKVPATAGAPAGAPVTVGGDWIEVGPHPQSDAAYGSLAGRFTAIAVDLGKDPTGNTVYVGAAYGGVWKSSNALAAQPMFTAIGDNLPSLAIGSIALDSSTTPTTLYVGTGEPNESGDSYYGVGILKSTDGGVSWTNATSTDQGSLFGTATSRLLVDTANPQVLVGGITYSGVYSGKDQEPAPASVGLIRSTDGGATWINTMSRVFVTDLIYDPVSTVYFAALRGSGLFKSTDRGVTWTALPSPFGAVAPNLTNFARASLAARGGVLYAIISNSNGQPTGPADCGNASTCSGLASYNGSTWTNLTTPTNIYNTNGQGFYDQPIAAPAGSTLLLVGGIDVWSADLSASTLSWTNLTRAYSSGSVHPDEHAIVALDATHWIIANDGGAWSTANAGTSWTNMNASIGAIQFYGVTADPNTAGRLLGGSQDNGTALATSGSLTWPTVFGGDGGHTAMNPSNPNQVFTENFDVSLQRSDDGGQSFTQVVDGTIITDSSEFYVPYTLAPSDPTTVYLATTRVWKGPASPATLGAGWAAVSQPLVTGSGDDLSAIAAAPSSADILYVGGTDGSISTTTNATSATPTWTRVTLGGDSSTGPISALAVNPTAPLTIIWAHGYVGASVALYISTDGGKTDTSIAGNLPGGVVNEILFDPLIPSNVYIGTDVGVFEANDGGSNGEQWVRLGDNLPATAVLSLSLTRASGQPILVAGTHGRGAWSIAVPGSVSVAPQAISFGFVVEGTSSAVSSATLTNSNATALTLSNLAITGANAADFSLSPSSTCVAQATVAAGGTCTLAAVFKPSTVGAESATVTVSDNATPSSVPVALSGTGASAAYAATLTPATLSFANQALNSTSAAQSLTLTNSGAGALAISSIAASGDFAQSNQCGSSLAAGATCAINVTFAPTATGSRTGTLTVTDNASPATQSTALSGSGTSVAASLSPSSITFNPQALNSASAVQATTLSNTGSQPLTVTAITVGGANAGDFAAAQGCVGTLAAGATCSVNVTFTPTGSGSRAASLSVADNAASSPQIAALSGTGADLSVGLSPGGSASATVAAGAMANYSLALTPSNGLSGTFAITCTGAPAAATCTPIPASVIITGTTAATVAIAVTTTARSNVVWMPLARMLWWLWLGLALGVLGFALRAARGPGARRRALAGAGALALAFSLAGCGGGGGSTTSGGGNSTATGTPAGTYTLTVTATSGTVARSSSLTLVVN